MVEEEWRKELESSGYALEFPAETAEILNGIRFGVDIEFTGDRRRNRRCVNLRTATDDPLIEQKVNDVIMADVAANKKAGPFDRPPFKFFSVSPIGAVPKKGTNKIRVIHHLSHPFKGDSINASITEKYQPLGNFDAACLLIRRLGRGCWLIKLDAEAAYKQVPVRPEDWPLLGFKWRGKWYYERVLPFGLTSSCRKWELYATALHYFLKKRFGVDCIVHYIDDYLFVLESRELAVTQLEVALSLCRRLGLPMSVEKTEGPTTSLTFLGIELDTVEMTAKLSDKKLSELRALLDQWKNKTAATANEIQSLAGVLNFACYVIRPGRAYKRRIYQAGEEARVKGTGLRRLSADMKKDLQWWINLAPSWNGVSLLSADQWSSSPLIELYTDACDTGYGAVYGNEWFYGEWTVDELHRARNEKNTRVSRSMPFLELLAAVKAAATWCHQWRGKKITFRSDASTVVFAMNNQNSRSNRMAGLVRHLSHFACTHHFDFRCVHVSGERNTLADLLSRGRIQEFRQLHPMAEQQPCQQVQLPPLHTL
jgi:hypothetical protein